MITDHVKFRNILAGIQSLIVAFAVVVGGIWTLVTFSALNETEIAKAEFEKLTKDLSERRVININIEASQVTLPGDSSKYILAIVRLENIGKDCEIIYWSKAPAFVTKVERDLNGQFELTRSPAKRIDPTGGIKGIGISAGEVVQMPFLARVDKPGLYFFQFEATPSEDMLDAAADEGVELPVRWGATTHVIIE